jgi:hypothetical protein
MRSDGRSHGRSHGRAHGRAHGRSHGCTHGRSYFSAHRPSLRRRHALLLGRRPTEKQVAYALPPLVTTTLASVLLALRKRLHM